MSKYVFFYKEQDTENRDCVKYIEIKNLKEKHVCIDGNFNVHGACFSMSFRGEEDYNSITTILTEEEFSSLVNWADNKIDLTGIINKLESVENQKLFEQVQQEEREYLKEEYSFDDEDIDYIFENYGLDYRDRGIVGTVFNDIEEAAQEEAESLGYVTKENERYFNYEKFGEDLLEGEQYLELPNGNIVYLNY